MRIFVCALLLAACSKVTNGGGHDLAVVGLHDGGATSDLALHGTGDMIHPLFGITCGNMQCGDSSQYCCTGDSGKSGVCNATNDFNCADVFFFCDGPEDCPPALSECCVVNGNANCVSAGECAGMSGTLMCHQQFDCGTGQVCCGAPGSPYSLCFDKACP